MPGILAPPSDVRLGDDFSDMSGVLRQFGPQRRNYSDMSALLRRSGPNGRNYSDMSALLRRFGPQRRNYSDMSEKWRGGQAGWRDSRGQRVTPRPHQPVTLTLP